MKDNNIPIHPFTYNYHLGDIGDKTIDVGRSIPLQLTFYYAIKIF